jgi:hypothetical protein
MKLFTLFLALSFFTSSKTFAEQAFEVQNPLKLDFQEVIKLVRDNINGWSKLSLDNRQTVWTPQTFYTQKISDPKKWIAQIHELGFCQPDKAWKNFPVLSVSNDVMSSGIEQVMQNPNLPITTQMVYSETVFAGGKARNVSYDFRQNGSSINVTCSASNELGDVQSIQQNFDIKNPKKFEVQQKKNGKLLEI